MRKKVRERESFSRNDTQKYNAYVHMRAYRKYRTKLTELNGWLKRLFLHVYCVCAPPYLSLCGCDSQFAIFTRYPSCRCLRCLSSTNTTHTHTFEQADNECTHTSIVCVCVPFPTVVVVARINNALQWHEIKIKNLPISRLQS